MVPETNFSLPITSFTRFWFATSFSPIFRSGLRRNHSSTANSAHLRKCRYFHMTEQTLFLVLGADTVEVALSNGANVCEALLTLSTAMGFAFSGLGESKDDLCSLWKE